MCLVMDAGCQLDLQMESKAFACGISTWPGPPLHLVASGYFDLLHGSLVLQHKIF